MFEDPEIKKESVQTSDEEIKEEMPTENAPENVPGAPVEAIPEAPAEPSEVTPEESESAPEIPQEEKSYAAGRVYSPENPEGAAYYRDVPFIRAEEGPVYEAPVRKKQKESGVSWLGVIALLLAVALLAGAGGYGGAYLFTKTHGKAPTAGEKTVLYQSVIRTVGDGEEEGGELTVSEVANIAAPSVVEIVTESVAYGTFFGQYTTSGAGSGVILSEDGLIVTNYHVIDGAKSIKVTLKNGEDYVGTLVGGDEQNDIALVRIEAEGLTPAVLGESASLVVGEGVVAVGNPLGELGGTVTDGIISALDREIEVGNASYTLLQTNAAVNPGNSGGGLFNMHGELIGIVNAKISENNVEGLGFAIPVDRAKGIIEELATYGYVRGRIDLGMQLIEINDAATAMYYNVTESGVYIVSVKDTTFGFAPGDLILSLDGKEILTMADLEEVINAHKVGDSLAAKVKRRVSRKDFQTLDLTLVLGEEVPSFIH